MRLTVALLFASAAAVAMPAQAISFFSLGGAPDRGAAPFETSLVSFDAPLHAGVTLTTAGTTGIYNGSSGVAAAPAGDVTNYMGIGTGGAATFDFRDYFAAAGRAVQSVSVYIGSIDSYNFVDILDDHLGIISTIAGSDLPLYNGDQGDARTNRRLYINFDPSEHVGGLTFRSTGVAFEFDNIAASSAIFRNHGNLTPESLPSVGNVPEPASWALMIAGFAMVGVAARRHRPVSVSA